MKHAVVFAGALVLAACKPDLAGDDALVTSTRLLAVRGEPAETAPGATATYTAFIAVPGGDDYAGAVRYAFCDALKPPAENAVVASACRDASTLTDVGTTNPVVAKTPADACSTFGPVTRSTGFRTAAPDETGGYYQPLRVDVPHVAPAFHLARLSCGAGQAAADVATEFAARYHANENPHISGLNGTAASRSVSLDALPSNARVTLTVHWAKADAEKYVSYDADSASLVDRRESMQLAWYVDGGALETESTSVAESDPATSSSNVFFAPASGEIHLWVVLRDARGGVDVLSRTLVVAR
ncbi:MAG TPA: hypothetical protein VH062_31390 [Polyangiaceae bacterium]|jgi:hypothetical protein|nr:hypothetical protein [Polyangiaceae bacterium]